MLSTDIQELDLNNTKKLLKRLDEWRNGICPNGTLAKEPCFVLEHRPAISIHPDQSISSQRQVITTELITEREWSDNLIDCGAITHLNDDILMKTMSDFFMIFHSSDKVNNCNTLHSLQLRKHASFKVDTILRPTSALQLRIQKLLKDDTSNLNAKWDELVDIWNTFGYLWPRKIILGYKIHLKESYKFKDGNDSTDGYYYHLNILRDTFHHQAPKDQPFNLDHFLKNATIVSRVDIAPIHEFFDPESRDAISQIIYTKFVQVPVYYPIKIYNVYTNSYLCWDPYGNSQQDPSFDGDYHNYLVRAVSAEPLDLSRAPESQYIWRMAWRPTTTTQQKYDTNTNDTFDPEDHRPQTVRGCSKVYIYPACESVTPKIIKKSSAKNSQAWHINDRMEEASDMIETHKMVLSCRPYRHETKVLQSEYSKLRPLRLLAHNSSHYSKEKIDWTIEYPNNGLKYMTDAQANIKLNFHEHVRRLKPLLIGDVIQLQQIGLLTAFNPISKLTDGLPAQRPNHLEQQQPSSTQSLRTAKRIIARKPSLKSKNKKNVLCVDEDFTVESWRENTFWKIELVTKADMNRHSSNFIRWPQTDYKYGYPKDYHPLLTKG